MAYEEFLEILFEYCENNVPISATTFKNTITMFMDLYGKITPEQHYHRLDQPARNLYYYTKNKSYKSEIIVLAKSAKESFDENAYTVLYQKHDNMMFLIAIVQSAYGTKVICENKIYKEEGEIQC